MNGTTSQAPTVHSTMKKQWQLRQEGQPGAGSQDDPGNLALPARTLSSSVWASIEEVSALSESDDSQESSDSVSSSQKSRDILSRRPSYREILSELSAGDTAKGEGRGDGEAGSGGSPLTTVTVPAPVYQTSTGQYIAITPGGTIQLGSAGSQGVHGLQTLTVTNAAAARPGAVLQLTPTADGQHLLLPSNQVVVQTASGEVQTYQIHSSPGTNSVPQTNRPGEATLKREIRLMKNREAARQCRRKKKEYVKCLENRVLVLENQNKTLIEELKALKDLYCQKSA